MAILVRSLEGKIYYTKFDDLEGWTEEEYLTDVYGENGWAIPSSSFLNGSLYYSSPYSLTARITNNPNAGNLPVGRYLRRSRTITIPAGLTSVRMQLRHRWNVNLSVQAMARKVTLGDSVFLNQEATDNQNTWYWKNDIVSTSEGVKALKVGVESYATVYNYAGNIQDHHFDDLVVCRSGSIKVKNLSTGWKAKLYDSSDALIAQASESGGIATLDVSSKAYPITGRIKIFDASDVLQFTSNLLSDIFGGDEYAYGAGCTLSVEVDNYIINRTGTTSPTLASITFTLKDELGNPLSGETINFSTTHGSLGASSGVTGGDGKVSVTLTASSAGIAVVEGLWPGTATRAPQSAYVEVSVHHDADSADSAKEYDVWAQGKRMYDCLAVRVGSNPSEHVASFETPDIGQWLKGRYDFAIYRLGTKLFFGKIEVLTKTIAPTPITRAEGRSMIQSLMRIPITSASYTNQSLKAIIESIHSTYIAPTKQVLLDEIGGWLENITATINASDTTVYDILLQVAGLGNATLRVDADRKMHVK